jgi:hypothetical protein
MRVIKDVKGLRFSLSFISLRFYSNHMTYDKQCLKPVANIRSSKEKTKICNACAFGSKVYMMTVLLKSVIVKNTNKAETPFGVVCHSLPFSSLPSPFLARGKATHSRYF